MDFHMHSHLFHARPWKHPPQSRHSFPSKGPTPSLSVVWLVVTHAVRHTDYSLETHSFFSYHLGDTLLPLFVICSRHTTSSLHDLSDTRIPPDSRGTVVAAWRHTQQAFLTHREILLLLLGDHTQRVFGNTQPEFFIYFICIGDSRLLLLIVNLFALLAVHLAAHLAAHLTAHLAARSLGSSWLCLALLDSWICDVLLVVVAFCHPVLLSFADWHVVDPSPLSFRG